MLLPYGCGLAMSSVATVRLRVGSVATVPLRVGSVATVRLRVGVQCFNRTVAGWQVDLNKDVVVT